MLACDDSSGLRDSIASRRVIGGVGMCSVIVTAGPAILRSRKSGSGSGVMEDMVVYANLPRRRNVMVIVIVGTSSQNMLYNELYQTWGLPGFFILGCQIQLIV